MPTVWIPSLLRDLTGGRETVSVTGATVREVIASLEQAHPGVRARLCDGDSLRSGIAVAVDAVLVRRGLSEAVGEHCEVHFVPAIAGG
ncbi:MAG: MoaD/ThiS family protein [Gemmataceae bacterium]|nr:MoaD/ThiS family protein [Gemmataceae bacterium]